MAGAATVEKALDVLFHLHAAATALGPSEIGRALDLPKSSCHRLLASLLDREVVERDEAGLYRPGLALLSLGIGAQAREPVVAASRPILEAEVSALGETVFLVASRAGKLRVLDKLEGTGFLRAAPAVGDIVPSDVTAAGKLYRIFGPEDAFDTPAMSHAIGALGAAPAMPVATEAPAAPVASADPVDPTERDAIRRSGYAINRNAWIEGLSVCAVPVWQPSAMGERRLVAVLALAAASARFDDLGEAAIATRLLAAADSIAARLTIGGALRTGGADRRRKGDGR